MVFLRLTYWMQKPLFISVFKENNVTTIKKGRFGASFDGKYFEKLRVAES